MATSSSSTKKAARLAQKGKGQKVRFQGGALFPFIVALVFVLGFGLVVYARESRPAADASAPRIEDHWHHTYGFFVCGEWVQLEGDGEGQDANGQPTNVAYARSGVHSHDDGLIHWHPFSSAAVGRRAQLGVFLDTFDVELSNDVLAFPDDQLTPALTAIQEDGRFESDETECPGVDGGDPETGKLRVVRWDNVADTDEGTTFIRGFDEIALDRDAMAVVIAFVPDGTDIEKPPWNDQFAENVSNDTNQPGAGELFPGADVSEDGDVTVGSNPLEQDDVGPAVDAETDTSEPAPTDTAATSADDG